MKIAFATMMSLALLAFSGCLSSQGGGMSGDEGFKIKVPTFDVKAKQGEIQDVTVSLKRGENFKRDVTLEFKPTKGISVKPGEAVVKANEKPDVHLKISAPKDAAIGVYRVYVKGTPQVGQSTTMDFKVNVVAP